MKWSNQTILIVITRALYILSQGAILSPIPILIERQGSGLIGEVSAAFVLIQAPSLVMGTWIIIRLTEKVGELKKVILGTLGVFLVSMLFYLLAFHLSSIFLYFIAQFLNGATYGVFNPVMNTLVEKRYKKGSERTQRGGYQALLQGIDVIGGAIGIGLVVGHQTYLSIGICIGAAFIGLLILWRFVNVPTDILESSIKFSWRIWESASFKAAYLAVLVAHINGIILVCGALYIQSLGYNPAFLNIGELAGIPAMIAFGMVAQKTKNTMTALISLVFLASGLVVLISFPSLPLLCGALLQIGVSGGWISLLNIAQEAAGDRQTLGHSTYLLMWRSGIFSGQVVGPHLGFGIVWYYSLGVLGVVATVLLKYREKEKE